MDPWSLNFRLVSELVMPPKRGGRGDDRGGRKKVKEGEQSKDAISE